MLAAIDAYEFYPTTANRFHLGRAMGNPGHDEDYLEAMPQHEHRSRGTPDFLQEAPDSQAAAARTQPQPQPPQPQPHGANH